MDNIVDIMIKMAEENPAKIALVDPRRKVSFAQLQNEVKQTAQHFEKKGINAGDKVLVLVPFSIDLYRTTLALNYLGAAAIFIEGWISVDQIRACCEHYKPDAIIGSHKTILMSYLDGQLRSIPLKINYKKYKTEKTIKRGPYKDPDALSLISFTSGSSGAPKQVERSFSFLHHQFKTLSALKNNTLNDVELVSLPAFVFLNLAIGSTSVLPKINALQPEKMNSYDLAQQIIDNKVNTICCSPFILQHLLEFQKENQILDQIVKIVTGGAPVFPNFAGELDHHFPKTDIMIIYGSSEAEPISTTNAKTLKDRDVLRDKGLYVGHIHPGTFVNIEPIQEKASGSANQNIGEIYVSGPNVVPFRQRQLHDKNLHPIGHPTGDTGYLIEKNELILTGPVSSILQFEHQVIAPFVFEALCQEIEEIARGTIAIKDQQRIALIQAKPNANQKNIQTEIQTLPYPIDKIIFVDKIPLDKRHHGKILYKELEYLIP